MHYFRNQHLRAQNNGMHSHSFSQGFPLQINDQKDKFNHNERRKLSIDGVQKDISKEIQNPVTTWNHSNRVADCLDCSPEKLKKRDKNEPLNLLGSERKLKIKDNRRKLYK